MFDVDGVLADWTWGFTRLLHEKVSAFVDPIHEGAPVDWQLSHIDPSYIDQGWKLVKETPWWWLSLDPLATRQTFGRIVNLGYHNRVYFVTSRAEGTPHVLRQTQMWLESMHITRPNVITSKKKGEFAALVKADFAIDDKPENAACIHWLAPRCKSYLLDYPKMGNKDFLPKAVKRVTSLSQFLDDVEAVI